MIRANRLRSVIAIASVAILSGAVHAAVLANVKLTGSTKDCFMSNMVPVGGVNLAAFQVSAARPIGAQLDSMRNFTGFATHDTLAFKKYDALESQLQTLIVTTRPLARASSAADGSFSMSFAPVDSVLLIGFADREDTMYFYGYRYLSGQASTSVVLDMSRGACPP
jgi:hypothetical protein